MKKLNNQEKFYVTVETEEEKQRLVNILKTLNFKLDLNSEEDKKFFPIFVDVLNKVAFLITSTTTCGLLFSKKNNKNLIPVDKFLAEFKQNGI